MNEIKTILDKVVYALADVSGIQAIVLGGSRARALIPLNRILISVSITIKATLDLVSLNKAAQ